jgi:hypothetical protein
MPIRGKKLLPSSFTEIRLLVDSYDNNILGGRIYHIATKKLMSFMGIYDFLSKLEGIYDAFSFPQAAQELRSFRKSATVQAASNIEAGTVEMEENEEVGKGKDINPEPSEKGTFVIRVMFRQNATWQGSIQWIEGKKTQNFRSDLEMLKLIDDALRSEEDDDDIAKWE